MFIKILILSIVLISFALLGLGIQVLFNKAKNFPESRVGHNSEMRKRKIYCMNTQQKMIDKGISCEQKFDSTTCAGCSELAK